VSSLPMTLARGYQLSSSLSIPTIAPFKIQDSRSQDLCARLLAVVLLRLFLPTPPTPSPFPSFSAIVRLFYWSMFYCYRVHSTRDLDDNVRVRVKVRVTGYILPGTLTIGAPPKYSEKSSMFAVADIRTSRIPGLETRL